MHVVAVCSAADSSRHTGLSLHTAAALQVQQEELARMAAEHAQKAAEQRMAEAVSDAQQTERDDNAVQRRLADQAGTIMGLQHSLQSAQADLHKFHSAHAR
jgi:hypothetical protein